MARFATHILIVVMELLMETWGIHSLSVSCHMMRLAWKYLEAENNACIRKAIAVSNRLEKSAQKTLTAVDMINFMK